VTTDVAGLFAQYAREQDLSRRCAVAFRNPALLTKAAVASLIELLESGRSPSEEANDWLAELDHLRGYLIANPLKYPFGTGPIEPIVDRVASGQITPHAAIARVSNPAFREHLSQTYLVCLLRHAQTGIGHGPPDPAWYLGRVILGACVAANPEGPVPERLAIVTHAWNQVVNSLLNHVPRGDVFHWSVGFLDSLLDRAEAANQPTEAGEFLHALGALHSDPFVAARTPEHYGLQVSEWFDRLKATYGDERASDLHKHCPLPEAKVALNTAITYFRRAVPKREGEHRGISLKAIVSCLFWLKTVFSEIIDLNEVGTLIADAFALLPPASYHEIALRQLAAQLDVPLAAETRAPAATETRAPPAENEGGVEYPNDAVVRAQAIEGGDPAAALALLIEAAPNYGPSTPPALRSARWILMATLIPRAAGVELPDLHDEPSFRTAFEELMNRSRSERWPADKVAAATFGMSRARRR
jgi:hypothetical protein